MPDFLPRADAAMLAWSANFDRLIHLSPGDYGLSPADAADYRALHLAFAEALRRATDPVTRTAPAVQAKRDARAAVVTRARQLAKVVSGRRVATAEQRFDLGLKVRKRAVRRVAPPADPPLVDLPPLNLHKPALPPMGRAADLEGLRLNTGTTVSVRLSDAASPTRKARPHGAFGAVVYTFIGETPPENIRQWRYHANTGMTAFNIDVGPTPPGSCVWVVSQWFSRRGERGPISRPVSTRVVGSLSAAA